MKRPQGVPCAPHDLDDAVERGAHLVILQHQVADRVVFEHDVAVVRLGDPRVLLPRVGEVRIGIGGEAGLVPGQVVEIEFCEMLHVGILSGIFPVFIALRLYIGRRLARSGFVWTERETVPASCLVGWGRGAGDWTRGLAHSPADRHEAPTE
ncbi:hypothetical protein KRR38_16615 [Novosphingobium sp. G106]|uniref:hypothetical protein n=1 Tax=Novosphingobium sp. G106 TaxID=2849500 RepID=UPI001C2DBA42|nr:hypothetical protein [Novosphingobium sp. G106]MBV1689252.1 hypothetical protein [Novosphingobium sp. G106]